MLLNVNAPFNQSSQLKFDNITEYIINNFNDSYSNSNSLHLIFNSFEYKSKNESDNYIFEGPKYLPSAESKFLNPGQAMLISFKPTITTYKYGYSRLELNLQSELIPIELEPNEIQIGIRSRLNNIKIEKVNKYESKYIIYTQKLKN